MNIGGVPRTFASAPLDDPESGSLSNLRDFLKREWRLICLITLLSLALGGAYVAFSPSRFTAQADMRIDTKKIAWKQSEEMASEVSAVDDATVESEMETTKSEKIAKMVVERLRLTDDPEFVGSGAGLWSRLTGQLLTLLHLNGIEAAPSSDDRLRSALATLKSNLRVNRVGRSYVEEIVYTSLVPAKAANIANAFADAYIEDQLQAKYEQTHRASDWLQQRIAELRQQATDAYKAVQDFKAQNNIIVGNDGKLSSDVELDQLGIALAKARAATSEAKAKLDRIQGVLAQRSPNQSFTIPDPIVTDALSSPVITKLRQQFLEEQTKEVEWSGRYGADHQAVKNLRADMRNLQNSIWDEVSRIAESYKSELHIAQSQEAAIDSRMTDVFQKSGSTRQSQVRLRELETAANTYRGIYETFLSRFTQSVQQQSFPSTEARVVTEASAPRRPSWPKLGITLAFATVCGLGLGAMSAIAREQLMNRRIHKREQLEKLLGLSCLAVFPALSKLKSRLGRGNGAFRQLSEASPFSATAEALRYIKVAIDLHPAGAKVIGVVSSLPGEGKTTIAMAFAAFAANSGLRTLLIDADMRNPSISRTLGYGDRPGLVNLATDRLDLSTVLIADPRFHFDVLPSSTKFKPANSADVLVSPAVKSALKRAAAEYEYVIVDLPPILSVVDVKAAAELFDAFLLVVEWGSTPTNEILSAVRSSPFLSERLLGAVLNKADEALMRRFEGYSGRRYDYYAKAAE
jgi:succinoglycan biosynthesis transport protein ExoP